MGLDLDGAEVCCVSSQWGDIILMPSRKPQGWARSRDCHQRCSNLVLRLLVKAEAGSVVQVVFLRQKDERTAESWSRLSCLGTEEPRERKLVRWQHSR